MTILRITQPLWEQVTLERLFRLLVTAIVFVALYSVQAAVADAQEVRNTIRDYLSGPIDYSPDDPWTRGKVFNLHTGHAGRYYNCDGEECKRNSPYICWKTHYESDLPPRRGLWRGLKMDLADVRQRICDGAGPCCDDGCTCADCLAGQQNGSDGPYVDSYQTGQLATQGNPTELIRESAPVEPVKPASLSLLRSRITATQPTGGMGVIKPSPTATRMTQVPSLAPQQPRVAEKQKPAFGLLR